MANAQPKPAFYITVGVVVVALIALSVYRWTRPAPEPKPGPNGGDLRTEMEQDVEANKDKPKLTVPEYKVLNSNKIPEVTGASAYTPLKDTDNTVRFAINVWAGWAPIILANDGFKPGKVWKSPDGKEFKLELVLMDNPVTMFDAYAAGKVHLGWGTLDMVPLFLQRFVDKEGKPKDSRIMPRIFQQVDWSNGGDGIVTRGNVKTVSDLRGKKIALAENSPSHYFALTMLAYAGVQPSEVEFVFTEDAFQAAAAFNAQKNIAAGVSWAPDIYNLEKVKGNSLLVTTSQANKLIADVWFARADFARDHPGVIEALVRGIFDAMDELKKDPGKKKAADLMAKGYGMEAADALGMLGDAHSTNWAENQEFFLDPNNPSNFERVWNQAYVVYRRVGSITHQPVPFNQVMDFSVIEKLGKEDKYKNSKNEYKVKFTPQSVKETKSAAEKPILTNTVYIRFYPSSWDLHKKLTRKVDGKEVEELYDPNVDAALEQIAGLAGKFEASRIVIEGHTDTSMKGSVPPNLVKELSLNRANAVKEALVNKFKIDPNRIGVEGMGWEHPADDHDQSKNRRVEVMIYPAESPG